MIVSSLASLGLAIIFLFVSSKVLHQILQLLTFLIAIFWLCSSWFFSIVPSEFFIAIAFLLITQKMHALERE
ncbi:hypothetical protein F7734_18545 [Scytonema sp. UIC 10036]|uniref:hypothetical protein n=1 Tax=Scytonema sp. UIC 10036 TaxID=2304196 RepID=UPI0012DAA902|nr:hypothetical protein [Scytonema sp. UIC 10036]MUG94272.1 hypothetical protein [Scytonema sp. UIC 10036]